jgi:hypothetical protein
VSNPITTDITVIIFLLFFFVVLGFVAPYMNAEFNAGMQGHGLSETGVVSPLTVLFSIGGMFFWSFGSIPLWLELCFIEPLRILLYIMIYRSTTGSG